MQESDMKSEGKLSKEQIEELIQETIENKGIEIVRQMCKHCENYNKSVLQDEVDMIVKYECVICGYDLVLKVSNSHDIYSWSFGAKIPKNVNNNNSESNMGSHVLSQLIFKRKLYTNENLSTTYQTVTVSSDIDYLPLTTPFIEVDKNSLPSSFKNPFRHLKEHKSFKKFVNNRTCNNENKSTTSIWS